MRVGIDIDGVVADFTYSFTRLMRDQNPTAGVPIKTGYEQEHWSEYEKASQLMVDKAWRWIDGNPMWWYDHEVMISRSEIVLLHRLVDEHDIYFITNRHERARDATRWWIQDRLGLVDSFELIHSNDKVQTCRDNAIDIMIDDSPKNLLKLVSAEDFSTYIVRMIRPYNEFNYGAEDVHTFADFCKIVKRNVGGTVTQLAAN